MKKRLYWHSTRLKVRSVLSEIAKAAEKSDSGGITRLSDYTLPHS